MATPSSPASQPLPEATEAVRKTPGFEGTTTRILGRKGRVSFINSHDITLKGEGIPRDMQLVPVTFDLEGAGHRQAVYLFDPRMLLPPIFPLPPGAQRYRPLKMADTCGRTILRPSLVKRVGIGGKKRFIGVGPYVILAGGNEGVSEEALKLPPQTLRSLLTPAAIALFSLRKARQRISRHRRQEIFRQWLPRQSRWCWVP